jgi:hypothetical protein
MPSSLVQPGGIRTCIPPVGTGGDIYHHRAESAFFAHRDRRPSVVMGSEPLSPVKDIYPLRVQVRPWIIKLRRGA